ncbi:uncharacterized protein ACLA_007840 [Aspergillus clavatus NRRL 1]|uniref:Uncharacterized protein n=1 Tax=Aspergillus clavatus (strain ATCC 1007 / CBS 513.65 / DSM 816 / NCTC 3887 / NRRL 1 / QM 1276 / 107) TaxID=344612 RepID=A1CDU7_ASPCL|nr:uncharacterized protein ACLA_007840 [Aspergillus clavatus NRRL 1]EAW12024.1 hypothetical protein ACLA_007840 [Aspergillus clavatus NRRL 1]
MAALQLLQVEFINPTGFDVARYIGQSLPHRAAQANTKLKTYKSWDLYCQGFTRRTLEEGSFAIARYYQLEVISTDNDIDPLAFTTPIAHRTRGRELSRRLANVHLETPSKSSKISKSLDIEEFGLEEPPAIPEDLNSESPSPFQEISPAARELENVLYPPTKDEQIVNCALVIFLNALTLDLEFTNKWTLHRKAFKASFEARTDGYLEDRQGNAKVIIEVKPVKRSRKLPLIQMQESAQVVAWIKSDDEKLDEEKMMRIIVSQGRHETYVTVAEYDENYIEYLNSPDTGNLPRSFMTMHQFGPWNTLDLSHIRYLGPVLLATSLQAEDMKNKT